MRRSVRLVSRLAFCVFVAVVVVAGTPGSFRGTVVDGPHAVSGSRWIYVQGRNGAARRVEISNARVSYDEAVPAANRHGNATDALMPGAEVRVSAEQGPDGEWKANRIEILKTAPESRPAPTQSWLRFVPQSKEASEIFARLLPDFFGRHA